MALILRRALTRTLAVLLISTLNPFGLTPISQSRSLTTWERARAPLYPWSLKRPFAGAPKGRADILLVTLDEQSMKALDWSRPITLDRHALILDDVIQAAGEGHAPSAIFIDMLLGSAKAEGALPTADAEWTKAQAACASPPFTFRCYVLGVARFTRYREWRNDKACRHDSLAKIACIKVHGGVPIVYADASEPPQPDQPPAERSPALKWLDEVALTAPVFVSPPSYPIVEEQPDEVKTPPRLSPAAALYAARRLDETGGKAFGPSPDRTTWPAAFTQPLQLSFATGGVDPFVNTLRTLHPDLMKDCRNGRTVFASAARFLDTMLPGVQFGPPRPGCPYTHALPYQDLSSTLTPEQVRTLLGGKLVLIAGAFKDTNDLIDTVPSGALPGAYAHAMALDILLEKDAAYPQDSPAVFSKLALSWADVVALPVVFLLTVVGAAAKVTLNEPRFDPNRAIEGESGARRRRKLRIWVERAAVAAAFTLPPVLVFFALLLAPGAVGGNIVAIALVALLGGFDLFKTLVITPLWEARARFAPPVNLDDLRWSAPEPPKE